MKTSKLSFISKIGRAKIKGRVVKNNLSTSKFKHEFRVLSSEEVNQNRSKAYQFLTF